MIDIETKTFLGTWEEIVNYEIATDDELRLITDINGATKNTLDDVVFARTGYRNIDDYKFFEVICEEAERFRRS